MLNEAPLPNRRASASADASSARPSREAVDATGASTNDRAGAAPQLRRTFYVGLVDDHEVIAAAVHTALLHTPQLELTASAPTVEGVLARANGRLDLALLDLRLGDGSSPAANVERLVQAGCDVLVYTSGESRHLLREVARTPVLGILRKSEPLPVLTTALVRAARGLPSITPEWAATVENDPVIVNARLSAHEQRVLALFADGRTATAVAAEAGIALSTLEDYVRRIRTKYARAGRHAPTKIDLYKRAVEDGLLPNPNHR